MTPQQERWFSLICLTGFVAQFVWWLIGDWRESVERDFLAATANNATTGRDISYPVLAQQPDLLGILVALVVFAIGALLISGNRNPNEDWT